MSTKKFPLKIIVESAQLYSSNNVNMGKIKLMDSNGNWEWFCTCGHNNMTAEALREIADVLDNLKEGKLLDDILD